jgi:HAD superfamily hydrolase (TIGR01509 family)
MGEKVMCEAVIFDCDGVLVDSEILAMEVDVAILADFGLLYEPAELKRRFMGMPDSAFFPALSADSLARRGEPLPDIFPQLHAKLYSATLRERLTEVAGAARAVGQCRAKKAVASSSVTEMLRFKLEKVGLWEMFAPHIYSGDLVERGKPAPDLFLYAARELETEPSRCLVIEDSINGVLAGRAAGMIVWGFVGGGHRSEADGNELKDAGAERIIQDWAAFEAALAGP